MRKEHFWIVRSSHDLTAAQAHSLEGTLLTIHTGLVTVVSIAANTQRRIWSPKFLLANACVWKKDNLMWSYQLKCRLIQRNGLFCVRSRDTRIADALKRAGMRTSTYLLFIWLSDALNINIDASGAITFCWHAHLTHHVYLIDIFKINDAHSWGWSDDHGVRLPEQVG